MVPVRRVCVAKEYTVGPSVCVCLPKIYATRNNSFLKSGLSEYVLKNALSVVGCCGHETVLHILQTRTQISYVCYKPHTDQKGLKSVLGERYNFLCTASKPALGPIQSPIQRVRALLFRG